MITVRCRCVNCGRVTCQPDDNQKLQGVKLWFCDCGPRTQDSGDDCIYPDCQTKTEFGYACEHSCLFEKEKKKKKLTDPDEIARSCILTQRGCTTSECALNKQYEESIKRVREALHHAFDIGFRAAGGQC